MADQGDPPPRGSLRRSRFDGSHDRSRSARLRDELPEIEVATTGVATDQTVDAELTQRCEVILEQVAEINGILARVDALPVDYADECRDRLVDVSRCTEEILQSVAPNSNQPGSMSAWLLRLKRQGESIFKGSRKTH